MALNLNWFLQHLLFKRIQWSVYVYSHHFIHPSTYWIQFVLFISNVHPKQFTFWFDKNSYSQVKMIIASNRSLCSNSGTFTSIWLFAPGQAWDFNESLFFSGCTKCIYRKLLRPYKKISEDLNCITNHDRWLNFCSAYSSYVTVNEMFRHCHVFSVPQGFIIRMNRNPTEQEYIMSLQTEWFSLIGL
jgi:hypothetical protein